MDKTSKNLIAGAILAACFILGSGFQNSGNQSTYQNRSGNQQQPMAYNKASEIVGMNVRNQNDEKLGEIKDVVFDLKNEHVAYAVLGTGGLMNSEKYYAVPLNAFTPSADGKHLVLHADKNKLETAQGFDKKSWPSISNPSWGAQPFWENPNSNNDMNK